MEGAGLCTAGEEHADDGLERMFPVVGIEEQLTPYKKYQRQNGSREKRRRGVGEKASVNSGRTAKKTLRRTAEEAGGKFTRQEMTHAGNKTGSTPAQAGVLTVLALAMA